MISSLTMTPAKKASTATKVPPKKKKVAKTKNPAPLFVPLPRGTVFANVNGLGAEIYRILIRYNLIGQSYELNSI